MNIFHSIPKYTIVENWGPPQGGDPLFLRSKFNFADHMIRIQQFVRTVFGSNMFEQNISKMVMQQTVTQQVFQNVNPNRSILFHIFHRRIGENLFTGFVAHLCGGIFDLCCHFIAWCQRNTS